LIHQIVPNLVKIFSAKIHRKLTSGFFISGRKYSKIAFFEAFINKNIFEAFFSTKNFKIEALKL